MNVAFQHKFQRYQLLLKKHHKLLKIDEQERLLKEYTHHELKVNHARIFYAASRITALVRGFLDRVVCRNLRKELRAMQLIQRIMKGKLGRIRWRKEYWRSLSIVKSDHALKEILERSTMIREKVIRYKRQRNHWKEMYDPLTDSFWYYNAVTKQNTWEIPLCFQSNLICHWDGYDHSGGVSSHHNIPSHVFINELQRSNYQSLPHVPCRCVFSTVSEYRNHLRTVHTWYCTACFNKNPGLVFPQCTLCHNQYAETGESSFTHLQQNLEKVQQQLQDFIEKDFTSTNDVMGSTNSNNNPNAIYSQMVPYHIRDRLIEIALDRKEMLTMIEGLVEGSHITDDNQSIGSSASTAASSSSSSAKVKTKQLEELKANYIKKMSVTFSKKQERANMIANAFSSNTMTNPDKLPPIPGAVPRNSKSPSKLASSSRSPSRSPSRSRSAYRRIHVHKTGTPAATGFDRSNPSSRSNNDHIHIDYYSRVQNDYPPELMNTSIIKRAKQKQYLEDGGEEGEEEKHRDPITKGIFSEPEFNIITSIHDEGYGDWQLELLSEGEEEDDNNNNDEDSLHPRNRHSHSSDPSITSKVSEEKKKKTEELEKQFVCTNFLKGLCTRTTCPSAHPGIRDRAKIRHKSFRNPDGKGRTRIPFVQVCPHIHEALTDCPQGRQCPYYHRYIRPSTTEIILALYPITSGQKIKHFTSGAKYIGNVKDNTFHGYGKLYSPDGSVYQGNWEQNQKHGYGIYTNHDGSQQYIGQFYQGKRQGWGIFRNELGDEYIGQWYDGKMSGYGILRSHNGDIYRGQFQNNHYHGIGLFCKSNGDVYLGYCMNGRAEGIGILSLRSGEKYKGSFARNARHGKGACLYPNGCKYVGYWYRGVHQGVGIFLSFNQEKYVGDWAGGRKHGNGRYYFSNGDFYDGQFHKDKAKGLGVYYYTNGNLFTGEWDNDMKNGRGTYVFANGSKYTGNFWNNNIHGKGKFDFATGAYYRGHFDMNTKHGKGIYTWPNGNIYKGDFYYEKLCGKGEMIYHTGHRYLGEWKNNCKNGYGIMYYANGAIYEGNFVNDIRQGFGKLTLVPGTLVEESYEGEWDQDQYHGKGKYCYRKNEGTVYEGDWVYGIREGTGTLSFLDGSFYRGEFKKDQMWGKGIFVDGVTNTQYDGEWRANMRQGNGTGFTSDGDIYHGEWFGNMKQGKGKIYHKDGSIYEGTWDANLVIGSGKMTIQVGDEKKKDGLPKKITVKVFGY